MTGTLTGCEEVEVAGLVDVTVATFGPTGDGAFAATLTTIVIVSEEFGGNVPLAGVQVTVPTGAPAANVHPPPLLPAKRPVPAAETKEVLAGSGSVTLTPSAALGPELPTVIV
jgi:hypothetical protein